MCTTALCLHSLGEALWVPASYHSLGLNLSLQSQPWPQQPGQSSDLATYSASRLGLAVDTELALDKCWLMLTLGGLKITSKLT